MAEQNALTEEKAAPKAQPVLDDEETGETFNMNSYSLMHQRVNQAQDINEQESGMEEKSNSQVLVLLKYLLTQ